MLIDFLVQTSAAIRGYGGRVVGAAADVDGETRSLPLVVLEARLNGHTPTSVDEMWLFMQQDRFVGLDPDLIWGLRGTCPQDYEADLSAPDLTRTERSTLEALYPVAVERAVLRYATIHGYSVSRYSDLGDLFGPHPVVGKGEEAMWHYPTRQAVAALCLWGRRWIVREVQ